MNNRKTSDLRFSVSGIDPSNEQDVYQVGMFHEMLLRISGDDADEAVFNAFAGKEVEAEEKPNTLSRDDFLQIYPKRPKAPVEYIRKDLEIGLYFGPRRRKEPVWKKVSECEIAKTGKMMSLYQIFGMVGISWVSVFVRPDGDDAKVCEAVDAKGESCPYFITDLEGQINLDL